MSVLVVQLMMFIAAFSAPAVNQEDIFSVIDNGDLAQLTEILDRKPAAVQMRDEAGRTPLHVAVETGHLEIVKVLIEHGADVNATDKMSNHPLALAVSAGLQGIAALLLSSGADANKPGAEQTPPVITAALNGDVEMVRLLVDAGADPHAKYYGNRVLGIALNRGNTALIALFVEKSDKLVASGEIGRELLHEAASKGAAEMVGALISKGANTGSRNNFDGSLLHSAACGGLSDLVDNLIASGMEVNQQDKYGLTPLHWAAVGGHAALVELLIDKGADIECASLAGKRAIHYAEEEGYEEVVDILVKKGADASPASYPVLSGPYLGQAKPGVVAEIFALGIISTEANQHTTTVFSCDGREMYFAPAQRDNRGQSIMFTELKDDVWTAPAVLPFSGKGWDCIPAVTQSGDRLFFSSYRRDVEGAAPAGRNLWFTDRVDGSWSQPSLIPPPVSSGEEGTLVSVAADGTLFFTSSRDGGAGDFDIYFSVLDDGRYSSAVNLGPPVNKGFAEMDPFVAPDKSYLVFTTVREGEGFGSADLYISFRREDDSWTEPVNLGGNINTAIMEFFPSVSPDGKYIFFARDTNGYNADIYWADASFIEELRASAMK